jgi:hypothetical protein
MNPLLTFVFVALCLLALVYFVNQNNRLFEKKLEMMENRYVEEGFDNNNNGREADNLIGSQNFSVKPSEIVNEQPKIIDSNVENPKNSYSLNDNQFPNDCFPKDQLNPAELLPADANSLWAQVNPNGQGELGDQNFLDAGFHTGINTVGSSMRNANRQLRSEPPNPQIAVSPWLQSTIQPDLMRRGLEIGS